MTTVEQQAPEETRARPGSPTLVEILSQMVYRIPWGSEAERTRILDEIHEAGQSLVEGLNDHEDRLTALELPEQAAEDAETPEQKEPAKKTAAARR